MSLSIRSNKKEQPLAMSNCDSVRTAASISRDLEVLVATMLVAYHRAIMAAVSDQRCCSAAMMLGGSASCYLFWVPD